jgi:hypothetical protein
MLVPHGMQKLIPVALMNDLPAVLPRHHLRQARHPFMLVLSAKTWRPTPASLGQALLRHDGEGHRSRVENSGRRY